MKSDCSGHPDKHLDRAQFQACHMFSVTIHYPVANAEYSHTIWVVCKVHTKQENGFQMWGGIPYAFQQCPKGAVVLTLVLWCHKQFITVLGYRPGFYLQWHPALSQLQLTVWFGKRHWIVLLYLRMVLTSSVSILSLCLGHISSGLSGFEGDMCGRWKSPGMLSYTVCFTHCTIHVQSQIRIPQYRIITKIFKHDE